MRIAEHLEEQQLGSGSPRPVPPTSPERAESREAPIRAPGALPFKVNLSPLLVNAEGSVTRHEFHSLRVVDEEEIGIAYPLFVCLDTGAVRQFGGPLELDNARNLFPHAEVRSRLDSVEVGRHDRILRALNECGPDTSLHRLGIVVDRTAKCVQRMLTRAAQAGLVEVVGPRCRRLTERGRAYIGLGVGEMRGGVQ